MTSYEKPSEKTRPAVGKFTGFDHVNFYVGNAKQVASFYILRLGFEEIAYAGLETGSREFATHVVKQNSIIYSFTSSLNPVESEVGRRVMLKGDAAKDVAFGVEDCEALYEKAISRGAKSVRAPRVEKDEFGSVILATVQTYGDTTHTFVQRTVDGKLYGGVFLPGFAPVNKKDPLSSLLPSPGLDFIDHIVGNQPDLKMEEAVQWYEKVLDFHRFWSVDDSMIHTEYSSLRSVVIADFDEVIKMPINEPAAGKRKSQIQEYCDYHGEGGVQHIAMNTDNILHAITNLRARGTEFLMVPKSYYQQLRERLAKASFVVAESLDEIERLNILVDFDDRGYLLQLFTKPVEDRPTLFYEIIQRRGCSGFGAGNFKALFEAIEREQAERGNLSLTSSDPVEQKAEAAAGSP